MFSILNTEVSLLAVLAGAIATMIVGMIWYNPSVFGSAWVRLTNKTMDDMSANPMDYLWAFTAAFAQSFVLALFIAYYQVAVVYPTGVGLLSGAYSAYVGAAIVAVLAWAGFTATSALNSVIWEGRRKKLYAFNMAHQLVTYLVVAVVIVFVTGLA